MWYVVDCEPDAFLYFGFEREISAEEMRRRIADHTITEALHKAPVHKGDVFFIGAGTIHAIGAGILLAPLRERAYAEIFGGRGEKYTRITACTLGYKAGIIGAAMLAHKDA